MILYGYALSSASFRVRIALALKNIPYTSVIKNLRVGEHRLAEYLNINAQGFVPALQMDDANVLTQSVAIMEYLDEQYPDPALLPSDAIGRARVRDGLFSQELHLLKDSAVPKLSSAAAQLDLAK